MIKAVIFDYGGTLAKTNTPWNIVSERIAARLELDDIHVEPVELEKAIKETISYRAEQHRLGLELDSYQFFNHALGNLGQTATVEITDELERYVYEETTTEFAEGLDELLNELSNDYKIALLSNSWLEAPRQTLRDHGYGRWFEVLLCSFDIGIPKPDPRIFRHILDLLMVEPSEAVMVGDSLKADVEGAIGAGLHAVLIGDDSPEWVGPRISEVKALPVVLREMNV